MRRRFVWALLALAVGCGGNDRKAGLEILRPLAEWKSIEDLLAEEQLFRVPAPPFSEGVFPCSRCHAGGEPVVDDLPSMPHRLHLNRDIECADCHNPDDEDADPQTPAAETCFDCHDDLETEPNVRDYFASIRNEDGKYVFPRRWKTRELLANHKGHAAREIACEVCHGQPSDEPYRKPKPVPLMEMCIACHTERTVRVDCVGCHNEIRENQHKHIVLRHAEDQRGCLDCHNPDDRDTLRLASGTAISFEESYRLCGQCHGTQLRDWKEGLHGKRTGRWDGAKRYLLCVHCHSDPHAPRFPKMKPDPPPVRPEDVK